VTSIHAIDRRRFVTQTKLGEIRIADGITAIGELTSGGEVAVKTSCQQCSLLCGVIAYISDGKVIRVEGDPNSPVNRGKICAKGGAAVEFMNHPARIRHPLKRAGAKGAGKWQRISWDEALETVAERMNEVKAEYGAESVLFGHGAAKGAEPYLYRLASLFGTPNIVNSNHVCSIPRRVAITVTTGYNSRPDTTPDWDNAPECVLMWGCNPALTFEGWFGKIESALARGPKLITVDPRKTQFAAMADLWLQLRPGTDLALALAMINCIVNEGLYDKDFVANWTVGFDKLTEHVQKYTPKWAEEITWVPAEKIIEAARIIATMKPATIKDGNGFDENINSVQTARAILIIMAVTGNLDVPGGYFDWGAVPVADISLRDKLPEEQQNKRIGLDTAVPIANDIALPQLVVKSILEGEPYPIRVFYTLGTNPMLTWGNVKEVHKALMKLDFLAVADRMMTPAAELADMILPAGTFLEENSISWRHPHVQCRQKVAEVPECWPDKKIINELAKKIGYGEYFWHDVDEALDVLLKPAGITFNEFRRVHFLEAGKEYRKYERKGFRTPSGKVELYSSLFEKWGHDPLPIYHEPPETSYSAPQLAEEYPLILTSWHNRPYTHSDYRMVASLRALEPEPFVEIHPETAKKLGIADGDMAYIETKRGRIKQRARLTKGIDPRVVGVSYGWWLPEQGVETLHGWAESNINILTDDKPPWNPQIGSSNFRGLVCRVYKVTE